MRVSPALTLGASAFLGLTATFLAWHVTRPAADEDIDQAELASAERERMVPVVVAKDEIERGAQIGEDLLTVVEWPANQVPYGSFRSFADVGSTNYAARKTLTAIAPGDPILDSRLSPIGMRASLAGRLEPGFRAYTIRMDDVSGVAGFVLPGDRVDVIAARETASEGGSWGVKSEVLLQDIEVLAVDSNDDLLSDQTNVFKRATLSVTVEDASKLSLAAQSGVLSLALRGTREPEVQLVKAQVPNPRPAPVKPRTVRPRTVTQRVKRPSKQDVQVVLGDTEESVTVPTAKPQS